MAEEKPVFVDCSSGLAAAKAIAQERRFGNWQVRFNGLDILCHDLLSFYIAAKDIFLHRIYDFASPNPAPRVIDGGGHIGLFTLFVKQRYPGARVTLFEPEELSLDLLHKNLNRNRIGDVEVIEAGLYSEDGALSFGSDASDGSSIFAEEKNLSINVTRLSHFLRDEIDFLKLNIEGAELDVISEIEPKLHLVREMVIEYHGFPEIGQNLHKILAILDRNGFRYMIHDFDSETNSASKPPFHLVEESRFFLLIYAKRLNNAKEGHPTAGDPLRSQPASRQFGFDRGTPIDRHYIEKFLDDHRPLIRGRVLEIGDASYTRRFGRDVARSEVLSAAPGAGVTLVGDLATGVNIPESAFDCIIMTQTIQMIYDVGSALGNAAKALRPGGSLLLTAPGISQISRYDMDRWGDYWRFTDKSLHKLLVEAAPDCEVTIGTHGNVAVAKAFLDGLALQELHPAILDYHDPDYQLVITATVTKPLAAKEPATASPVVLIYHRVSDLPLDPQLLCVSLENFDLHLRELASSRRVVPLFQLLGECRTGKPPAGSVALTFDDGYLDNLTNALPLLERYGLHATIFVTSGMVGSDEEFWWDALERIFLTGEKLPPGLDFGNRHWPLLTDEDKIAAYEDLCSMLRDFHPEAIDHSLRYLFEWGGISRIGRLSHRSVDHRQLRELATSPHIEIGAHAKHHVRLSNLPEHRQHVEILASKQQLEAAIGKPVRLFSYPFGAPGDFGQETAKAAAAAGFEAAIANVQGEVVLPLDFYSVPRRLVRNWNGAEFAGWLLTSDRNTLEAETTTKRLSVLRDALQAGERAFRQP